MPSCIARSVYSAKHMHELFLRRMIAVPTMVTMVKLLIFIPMPKIWGYHCPNGRDKL